MNCSIAPALEVVGEWGVMTRSSCSPGSFRATRKLLTSAGLSIGDIDYFEVNVHGGAIALGHPLGASGARLLTSLVNTLDERDGHFGVQLMCEGGGMANATLVERAS